MGFCCLFMCLKFFSLLPSTQWMGPGTKRCPVPPMAQEVTEAVQKQDREGEPHGTIWGLSQVSTEWCPLQFYLSVLHSLGKVPDNGSSIQALTRRNLQNYLQNLQHLPSLPLCAHLPRSALEHKELFPACLDFCSAWCLPGSRTDGTMGQVTNHGSQMKGKTKCW